MQMKRRASFSVEVSGVEGVCSAGEAYARRNHAEQRIPVLSCEGPCIRGEIARRAANIVAEEMDGSHARACHAETFFVPHSAMARWVTGARQCVMIDGCFLRCHGRVLEGLMPKERILHVDAAKLHRKYASVFVAADVPAADREETAGQVAAEIIALLERTALGATRPAATP